MRKFVPSGVDADGQPYHRVSFTAPGVPHLVIVEQDGIEVPESAVMTVPVFDPASGTYKDEEREVAANGNLLAALASHPHVAEVDAGQAKKKAKAEDAPADEAAPEGGDS